MDLKKEKNHLCQIHNFFLAPKDLNCSENLQMINLIITYCLSETNIFFVFILMYLCYVLYNFKTNGSVFYTIVFFIHTIIRCLCLLSNKLKIIEKTCNQHKIDMWINFTKVTFLFTIKTFLS